MNKLIIIPLAFILSYSCTDIELFETSNEVEIELIVESQTKTALENDVLNLSIFQFNNSTGVLIMKKHIQSYSHNITVTLLTPPDEVYDIYFIANAGDQTILYTEGSTNRREIDTSTFEVPQDGLYSTIPMAGKYLGNTSESIISATLERAVSKVTLTAKSNLYTDSLKLTIAEISFRSIPKRGRFFSSNESFPSNSSSYLNYTKKNINSGDTISWFIPENIQGSNLSITNYEDKNIHNMPTPNCSRITIATGYLHYHLFDYGETDIIVGGTNYKDFNVMRNTHYLYDVTISDVNDSRINWLSTNNTIPFNEHGNYHGNCVYYANSVWAPVNNGTDSNHPFGQIINYSSFLPVYCPIGWKLPTQNDYSFILSDDYLVKEKYYWEWDEGLVYISNYLIQDTLFFPAAGYYDSELSRTIGLRLDGNYLFTDPDNNSNNNYIRFNATWARTRVDKTGKMRMSARCILDDSEYQRYYYPLNN